MDRDGKQQKYTYSLLGCLLPLSSSLSLYTILRGWKTESRVLDALVSAKKSTVTKNQAIFLSHRQERGERRGGGKISGIVSKTRKHLGPRPAGWCESEYQKSNGESIAVILSVYRLLAATLERDPDRLL
ncbi:unnamed protein product [Victoria cruziana]